MKSFRIVAAIGLSLGSAAIGSVVVAASVDSQVHVFDAALVSAAFAKGAPLAETLTYKVHASRRDAAGDAEVHVDDTDIFYVLEGGAEVVTGGVLAGKREVAPNELRAPAIEGGATRTIEAGDVLIIPAGVPHWFRRVDGKIVYYVVKVTSRG